MKYLVLPVLSNARNAMVVLALLVPTTTPAAAEPKHGGPAPSQATAGDPKPREPPWRLKKSDSALKNCLRAGRRPGRRGDAKRTRLRRIVTGFLDFEELARRSLARHWDGLSAKKQRTDFVTPRLRDLIERSYIKQVHGFAELRPSF